MGEEGRRERGRKERGEGGGGKKFTPVASVMPKAFCSGCC